MAEVPKQIGGLIAKFDQNLDAYYTAAYGETEVRVEFINPFFEALGWDVTNKVLKDIIRRLYEMRCLLKKTGSIFVHLDWHKEDYNHG